MNNNFSLGNIAEWELVSDEIELPGVEATAHEHRFALLASGPIEVYAEDEMAVSRLVAVGVGLMRCRFTATGAVTLRVEGSGNPEVMIRRRKFPQVLPDSEQVSFANLAPRGAGPSLDLQRMMMYMRINEQRRDAQLQAALSQLPKPAAEAPKKKAKEKAEPADPEPAVVETE
jgi:hypothetical protein